LEEENAARKDKNYCEDIEGNSHWNLIYQGEMLG
jgi:hypothetical protein